MDATLDTFDINALANMSPSEMEALVMGAEKPAETAQPEPDPKVEEKPAERVKAADGKTLVPYGILKQARADKEKAIQENAQLRAELERLKHPAIPEPVGLSPEELAALEEYDPDVAKPVKAILAETTALKQQLAELRGQIEPVRQQAAQQEQIAKTQVDEAIDGVPTLAYLRDSGSELWDTAVGIDQVLRTSPVWASKPMVERFREVAKRMEADFAIELPAEYQSQEVLEKKAKAVKAKPLEIQSLSDIPGGQPPGSGEFDLANVSTLELGTMLQRMTRAQQDAFMAKFA